MKDLIKQFIVINPTHFGISQGFGKNDVVFYKNMGLKGHNGIDYRTGYGQLVLAPCDLEITGIVKENKDKGYGNTIWAKSEQIVKKNDKEYCLEMNFGHLSNFIKQSGRVMMGEPIAYTGNTGKYTTGPHLHFGTRVITKHGNGWLNENWNNGYLGYEEPNFIKSFQDRIMLFKDYKSSAVYWLGVNSEFIEIGESIVIKKLIGNWQDINVIQLSVGLPYNHDKLIISSKTHLWNLFLNLKN